MEYFTNSLLNLDMFIVSKNMLKIVAGMIWYAGSLVLILKATSLLNDAMDIHAHLHWYWSAIAIGIVIGLVKSKFIFIRSCRKNLERIASLDVPKLWQSYKISFYFTLSIMIFAGGMLSNFAQGNFNFLVSVAILDISIGVALLSSSFVFWKK